MFVVFRVVVTGEDNNFKFSTEVASNDTTLKMGRGRAHVTQFNRTTLDFKKFRHTQHADRPSLSVVNKVRRR